jgi:glycosyltransferase involved in cell wall biosynthesis
LLISHRHLHRPDRLQRAIAASQARLVVFVHDLIPIEYPEYGRPQQAELHLRRVRTVAAMADAVVVNSNATASALRPFLDAADRAPPVLVAPLGVQPGPAVQDRVIAEPYFVYLSTIEPRKNHLMLLHVWRRLAEMLGDATPHLVLVGRRGWENENIIDMLERSVAIRQHVTEWAEVTDAKIGALLHHSRALLFPSFAEGFGLPVAEALAAGVPVICSDLPALRETGGGVPDYLDPLDGLGWLEAVLHYTDPASPARDAQIARMTGWRPSNWPDHVRAVLAFLTALPDATLPIPAR